MKEALEIATSLPDPIAMPTSALARAGASLIPSPTIATMARLFSGSIFSLSPSNSFAEPAPGPPALLSLLSDLLQPGHALCLLMRQDARDYISFKNVDRFCHPHRAVISLSPEIIHIPRP